MARTLPLLVAAAAALALVFGCGGDSPSPAATPVTTLEDGMVLATEGSMNGGRVWFIWQGQRQRIQQPSGLEPDWLPRMGLSIGDPAPERLTVGNIEGTTWHVIPPFGSDAKLYLAYEGELHEVTILEADDAKSSPCLRRQSF